MINHIEDVVNKFEEHICKFVEEFDISLIYIFGSYAKGNNRKDSDIDIALLLNGEIDPYTKLNILGALVDIFKTENIDLVILNDVNEVLRFQVIKYGKLIYMESQLSKVLFETRTMSEYMDMEHFRNMQSEYSHKRFLQIMKGNQSHLI